MIVLTIKQLKRRVVQGLVEPELFYMPLGKKTKPETKDVINMATTFYRIHDNEMWYHYWSKSFSVSIDNVTLSNGKLYLFDEIIGTYGSSSAGGTTRYIISGAARANIYLDKIDYYGMIFTGISYPRDKTMCNIHKSNLLTCIKTAEPYINFSINNGNVIRFDLLLLYADTLTDFIGDFEHGRFEWRIYYDCVENNIKSYLMIRDTDDYYSVLKTSDTIVVYENFYNKGR